MWLLCTGHVVQLLLPKDRNLTCEDVDMQDDVLLSFTQEATGISWDAYMDLYCAGAKQLFFHEKPKVDLELEPVILSNL